MHYPDFATFSKLAAGVHLVPVYRRLIGDSLTPVSAFHKLDAGSSACLFESVVGGEKVGRYSFLAAEPFKRIEAWGEKLVVTNEFRKGRTEKTATSGMESDDQATRELAKEHGLDFVDLNKVAIPHSAAEIIPESVARENMVFPLAEDLGTVRVAMSDPTDFDTREKLRFILNRDIEVALAPRQTIAEAIDRCYPGQPSEFRLSADPLADLREFVNGLRAARISELPPFVGGAIGYAGYDVVRYCEDLPNAPADDRKLPDLSFAFYDHLVVFDNITKTIVVVAMARVDQGDLRAAYDDACSRVDKLVEKLSMPPVDMPPVDISPAGDPTIQYKSNFTQAGFEQAVKKCVEYIQAGDIFQVVISQRLEVPIKSHPFEIYRTLRVVNPSPFMFYLRTPSVTLVGSSPEVMVRVVDGKVTVRPLAGTRRRGKSEEDDRRLAAELLADPKERAEHVMLVDLGRNDVGRVAKYGSVELTDVMTIERYSHVMHITSNVTGMLADGKDAFDALRACLPAGTVSGAPKVRAMEIIDELEPHRRGPYAGAVGYVDYSGNMDTCIALRTIVIPHSLSSGERAGVRGPHTDSAGKPHIDSAGQLKTAYLQAGAGIVADSVPDMEWKETLNKARGLLKAIEITEERTK